VLDRSLAPRALPHPKLPEGTLRSLTAIGADRYLAQTVAINGVRGAVIELTLPERTTVVNANWTPAFAIDFEPSSQLATWYAGRPPEIDHYDPDHHTLTATVTVPDARRDDVQFRLVDPALAGGTTVVRLEAKTETTIEWYADPTVKAKPTARYSLRGGIRGVDRAARVYAYQANSPKIAVIDHGKLVGELPFDAPDDLAPDRKAERLAALDLRSVALYDLAGKQLWKTAIAHGRRVLWLDDNSLAVMTSDGVARIDARDGHVEARRCGARLELASAPHVSAPAVATSCAPDAPAP